MVPTGRGRYQESRTDLARNQKQKNIERQKRFSKPVSVKHKCWRRLCGLDGGLSKL